jgi:ankyrin repeat protein
MGPKRYIQNPRGGGASPGTNHPTVRMESEEVAIKLKPREYSVDAVFHMFNTGAAVAEPVCFPKLYRNKSSLFDSPNDFIRFDVWVDGKTARFYEESEVGVFRGFWTRLLSKAGYDSPQREEDRDRRWMVGKTHFRGNGKTTIRVYYEARYEKSYGWDRRSADYIFGTGRHWKGTIGRASFVIDRTELGEPIKVLSEFRCANPAGCSASLRRITQDISAHDIQDLEPEKDSDRLTVTLTSPQELDQLLVSAVSGGRLDEARKLVKEHGARINPEGPKVETPLMSAASRGDWRAAEFLLELGANVNLRGKDGSTALTKALENAHEGRNRHETALFLKSRGAEPTTLAVAAFVGDMDAVRRFIDAGADVDERTPPDGLTPLMAAALGGQRDVAARLLHSGCSVDAKDKKGMTALVKAVRMGQTKVLKVLLNAGADVNVKDDLGHTPLYHAIEPAVQVEVALALLDGGADINARDTRWSRTILMQASNDGSLDAIRLLLDRGAEVNAEDRGGDTALSLAKGAPAETIKKLLRAHGATK